MRFFLAKAIDGVYDSDPKLNPDAKKYDSISITDVVDKQLGCYRYDSFSYVHGKQDAAYGIWT